MDVKGSAPADGTFKDKETPTYDVADSDVGGIITENVDDLQRRLSGRQIQMITIGGSIGTALFVSIGSGLTAGGPGSLFIGFILYSCFLALVNNCMAEVRTYSREGTQFAFCSDYGERWLYLCLSVEDLYGWGVNGSMKPSALC